jgi:hypothetical protein
MHIFPRSATQERLSFPSYGFLCRAVLTVLFGFIAHLFQWEGLRHLTSEVILRLSAMLGMTTERISFDTVEIHGQLLQVLVSCTFVELFFGSLPLLWKLDSPIPRNFIRFVAAAGALFCFNVLRLEAAEIAYGRGLPWLFAHDIPLGFEYFAVWAFVWRTRSWRAWRGRGKDSAGMISLRGTCDLAH